MNSKKQVGPQSWDQVMETGMYSHISCFNTGCINAATRSYAMTSGMTPEELESREDYHVNFFHFHHPQRGHILIDSGFDSSYFKRPFGNSPFLPRIFYAMHNVKYLQNKGMDIESQLNERGIEPNQVFLTHMHPDHSGGLPALEASVKVSFGRKEKNLYYRLLSGPHLKGKEIDLLDFSKGFSLDPFDSVLDVLGDGSLYAISTPGHTKDHIAYFINSSSNPTLVVGDAELNRQAMARGLHVTSDYGKRGAAHVKDSAEKIRTFHARYPQVKLAFSHGA